MNPSAFLLLATWLAVSLILALPVTAIYLWLRQRNEKNERCLIIAPLVSLGLLGYLAFFSFVISPQVGRTFSYISIVSTGVWVGFASRPSRWCLSKGSIEYLPALAFNLGLCYLSILYFPVLHQPYFDQSSLRFIPGLPFDPVIPAVLGDRLFAGEPVRPFMLDWLSSDRPPLQSGLYLVVLPWLKLLRLPEGLGYQCVGTFCQLFWVPATWLMMCVLCRDRRSPVLGVLILAIMGFFLLNSVYVWPKLLAGSYALFAGLLLIDANPQRPKLALLAGLAAALGWLAHGGVAFSLIALVPLWVIRGCPYWRKIPATALLFLLIAGPWLWYQKSYDPPGDRLLKWHLAGTIPVDSRPLFEVLRTAYSELSWSEWVDVKLANIRTLFRGTFGQLFDFFTTPGKQRRMEEFFHFFRAIGVLNLAWLLWPAIWFFHRRPPAKSPLFGYLLLWCLLTLAVWVLLMFERDGTVIHQGSYTAMLVAYTCVVVLLLNLPRTVALPILGWHASYFVATWILYFGSARIDAGILCLTLLAAAGTVVAAWRLAPEGRTDVTPRKVPLPPACSPSPTSP